MGHKSVVNLLIKKKADIHLADIKGRTLLYYAALRKNTRLVKSLLEKDAEYLFENKYPPLRIAIQKKDKEIITLLLKKAYKDKQLTLLELCASENEDTELLKYIDEAKAQIAEAQIAEAQKTCVIM